MIRRRFEQILERCLQQVAHKRDIQAVLRHHPQHADHLRPLLEVAQATRRAYADVPEPPGGLAAGRRWLLDAAAQQRKRVPATQAPTLRKETKPKMKLALATKLIGAVLAAVIGIATAGGGVTLAASDSLPGDVLYPVKLTGEDLRLSLASTPESQVELALRFSDERVAEAEALADRGDPVPETVVARMERHIFRAMNQAAWASDEEMPGLLERIAQRTQAQAQTLEQLRARAQEQNQAQLENAQRVCQQARNEAMAGMGDPHTFRSRYQHRNSMPEDIIPPEPPTPEPQNGGEGPGPDEPGGPGRDEMGTPQGEPQGDGDQDRDRDRDRDCQDDPQQDRDRDREDEPQQDRDRDRDREDEPQQDRDRDRDREDEPQQDRDRDRQQDQDQPQDPPQDEGQPGGMDNSGGPAPSSQGGKEGGNGNK